MAAKRVGYPWGQGGLRLIAISYLAIILLVPLLAVVQDGLGGGLAGLWVDLTRPAARAALWLSLWTAAVMTAINARWFGTESNHDVFGGDMMFWRFYLCWLASIGMVETSAGRDLFGGG